MDPDRELCLCFHVSLRKVRKFIRLEKPKVASQLSQCYGAGTGCGWCRPLLRSLLEEVQSDKRGLDGVDEVATSNDFPEKRLEQLDSAEYADLREHYLKQGKGTAPG